MDNSVDNMAFKPLNNEQEDDNMDIKDENILLSLNEEFLTHPEPGPSKSTGRKKQLHVKRQIQFDLKTELKNEELSSGDENESDNSDSDSSSVEIEREKMSSYFKKQSLTQGINCARQNLNEKLTQLIDRVGKRVVMPSRKRKMAMETKQEVTGDEEESQDEFEKFAQEEDYEYDSDGSWSPSSSEDSDDNGTPDDYDEDDDSAEIKSNLNEQAEANLHSDDIKGRLKYIPGISPRKEDSAASPNVIIKHQSSLKVVKLFNEVLTERSLGKITDVNVKPTKVISINQGKTIGSAAEKLLAETRAKNLSSLFSSNMENLDKKESEKKTDDEISNDSTNNKSSTQRQNDEKAEKHSLGFSEHFKEIRRNRENISKVAECRIDDLCKAHRESIEVDIENEEIHLSPRLELVTMDGNSIKIETENDEGSQKDSGSKEDLSKLGLPQMEGVESEESNFFQDIEDSEMPVILPQYNTDPDLEQFVTDGSPSKKKKSAFISEELDNYLSKYTGQESDIDNNEGRDTKENSGCQTECDAKRASRKSSEIDEIDGIPIFSFDTHDDLTSHVDDDDSNQDNSIKGRSLRNKQKEDLKRSRVQNLVKPLEKAALKKLGLPAQEDVGRLQFHQSRRLLKSVKQLASAQEQPKQGKIYGRNGSGRFASKSLVINSLSGGKKPAPSKPNILRKPSSGAPKSSVFDKFFPMVEKRAKLKKAKDKTVSWEILSEADVVNALIALRSSDNLDKPLVGKVGLAAACGRRVSCDYQGTRQSDNRGQSKETDGVQVKCFKSSCIYGCICTSLPVRCFKTSCMYGCTCTELDDPKYPYDEDYDTPYPPLPLPLELDAPGTSEDYCVQPSCRLGCICKSLTQRIWRNRVFYRRCIKPECMCKCTCIPTFYKGKKNRRSALWDRSASDADGLVVDEAGTKRSLRLRQKSQPQQKKLKVGEYDPDNLKKNSGEIMVPLNFRVPSRRVDDFYSSIGKDGQVEQQFVHTIHKSGISELVEPEKSRDEVNLDLNQILMDEYDKTETSCARTTIYVPVRLRQHNTNTAPTFLGANSNKPAEPRNKDSTNVDANVSSRPKTMATPTPDVDKKEVIEIQDDVNYPGDPDDSDFNQIKDEVYNMIDPSDKAKYRTQMVLLQRKMGPITDVPHLLEILSSCDWDGVRSKVLSKISVLADTERYPEPAMFVVGKFAVAILPRPIAPTRIPKHLRNVLKTTLMHAIRIKIKKVDLFINTRGKKESECIDLTEDDKPTIQQVIPATSLSGSEGPSVTRNAASGSSYSFKPGEQVYIDEESQEEFPTVVKEVKDQTQLESTNNQLITIKPEEDSSDLLQISNVTSLREETASESSNLLQISDVVSLREQNQSSEIITIKDESQESTSIESSSNYPYTDENSEISTAPIDDDTTEQCDAPDTSEKSDAPYSSEIYLPTERYNVGKKISSLIKDNEEVILNCADTSGFKPRSVPRTEQFIPGTAVSGDDPIIIKPRAEIDMSPRVIEVKPKEDPDFMPLKTTSELERTSQPDTPKSHKVRFIPKVVGQRMQLIRLPSSGKPMRPPTPGQPVPVGAPYRAVPKLIPSIHPLPFNQLVPTTLPLPVTKLIPATHPLPLNAKIVSPQKFIVLGKDKKVMYSSVNMVRPPTMTVGNTFPLTSSSAAVVSPVGGAAVSTGLVSPGKTPRIFASGTLTSIGPNQALFRPQKDMQVFMPATSSLPDPPRYFSFEKHPLNTSKASAVSFQKPAGSQVITYPKHSKVVLPVSSSLPLQTSCFSVQKKGLNTSKESPILFQKQGGSQLVTFAKHPVPVQTSSSQPQTSSIPVPFILKPVQTSSSQPQTSSIPVPVMLKPVPDAATVVGNTEKRGNKSTFIQVIDQSGATQPGSTINLIRPASIISQPQTSPIKGQVQLTKNQATSILNFDASNLPSNNESVTIKTEDGQKIQGKILKDPHGNTRLMIPVSAANKLANFVSNSVVGAQTDVSSGILPRTKQIEGVSTFTKALSESGLNSDNMVKVDFSPSPVKDSSQSTDKATGLSSNPPAAVSPKINNVLNKSNIGQFVKSKKGEILGTLRQDGCIFDPHGRLVGNIAAPTTGQVTVVPSSAGVQATVATTIDQIGKRYVKEVGRRKAKEPTSSSGLQHDEDNTTASDTDSEPSLPDCANQDWWTPPPNFPPKEGDSTLPGWTNKDWTTQSPLLRQLRVPPDRDVQLYIHRGEKLYGRNVHALPDRDSPEAETPTREMTSEQENVGTRPTGPYIIHSTGKIEPYLGKSMKKYVEPSELIGQSIHSTTRLWKAKHTSMPEPSQESQSDSESNQTKEPEEDCGQSGDVIDLLDEMDSDDDVDIDDDREIITSSAAKQLKERVGVDNTRTVKKRKQGHQQREAQADDGMTFTEEVVCVVNKVVSRTEKVDKVVHFRKLRTSEEHCFRERQRRQELAFKYDALATVCGITRAASKPSASLMKHTKMQIVDIAIETVKGLNHLQEHLVNEYSAQLTRKENLIELIKTLKAKMRTQFAGVTIDETTGAAVVSEEPELGQQSHLVLDKYTAQDYHFDI